MLKVKNLVKNYGNQQILCDVTLSFGKGEIHGVVGENGAGKTTLFKCICGLEDHSGTVEYDGGILKNQTGLTLE